MRAYKVQAGTVCHRYAGTQAEAKQLRDQLMAQHELKKKEVLISEVEVPTAKAELLAFINGQLEGDK